MRLGTHIALGLLSSICGYFFLKLDFNFVLVAGFSSFLPDIDHPMQFKWGMGVRHRTFLHNIWAMLLVALVVFIVFRDLVLVSGIILGYLSHLLADSMTKTGVSWLYPIKGKFHLSGPLSMSNESEAIVERILLVVSIALTGFLFLLKETRTQTISTENMVLLIVLVFVGYVIVDEIAKVMERIIRNLGL